MPFTRRAFLTVSAAAMLSGCDESSDSDDTAPVPATRPPSVIYLRTGRGRRISRAAKVHNHNRRYATRAAALADTPHPGDSSRVVSMNVSRAVWDWYFGRGLEVIDLRWFQGLR